MPGTGCAGLKAACSTSAKKLSGLRFKAILPRFHNSGVKNDRTTGSALRPKTAFVLKSAGFEQLQIVTGCR